MGQNLPYVLSQEFSLLIGEAGIREVLEYNLSALDSERNIEIIKPSGYEFDGQTNLLDSQIKLTTAGSVLFHKQATLDKLVKLKEKNMVPLNTFVQKVEGKNDASFILTETVEFLLRNPSLIIPVMKNIWNAD